MPQWKNTRRFVCALALAAVSFISSTTLFAATNPGLLETRVAGAVSTLGAPEGVAVRAVDLTDGRLTVDFTPRTADGLTDGMLEALTGAVRDATREIDGITEVVFTAAGRPLFEALPPAPAITPEARPRLKRTPARGALSDKVIVLSPGHGWTYYGTNPYWHLQRSYYFGIVEDFVNQEIIQAVYNLLVNNGATVYSTREMDKSYPDCTTSYTFANLTRPAPNKPWWQMAAVYYAVRMGAPSSVYVNGRSNDYDRDIVARPFYANWRNADIMVSLHNNGGGGTGTETLYDTANGQTVTDAVNQYGSQYLAQKVQSKIVSRLRANYYSTWYDRSAKGFAGNYGENREADCPAILIESAFMDKETPDSVALRDENFKMLLAKAIYEGICDYFHVTPTYNTNISAPAGTWTAQTWNKSAAFKLDAPVNAPPSSAGGWVYAATDGGIVYGVSATPASGLDPGVRWRYPTTSTFGAPIKARPTVYGDTVYTVATNGNIAANDRITGARRWSGRVPNAGSLTASPAATQDGYVVVGSDNGFLYSYRQDTGELVGTSPVAFGPIRAQVAIPDSGHVWVTSEDGKVRCLSGDLKSVLWESDTAAPVRSAPYVLTANNVAYFTNEARSVFALNASNGNAASGWTASGARYGTAITTSPWANAESNVVIFGMANHTISAAALSVPTMPTDFPYRPAGVKAFTSDPVILDNTMYVGGTDGRLYGIRRSNGATDPGSGWRAFDVSREGLPGPFNAAPCLTGSGPDDLVAAGNQNGYLYLLPLM